VPTVHQQRDQPNANHAGCASDEDPHETSA
jgi:hypothetical protein